MKSYSKFVKKWSAMIKYVEILPAGVLNTVTLVKLCIPYNFVLYIRQFFNGKYQELNLPEHE